MIHQTKGDLPAPVLVLDADQGIEKMLQTYDQFKVESRFKFKEDLNLILQDEIRGRKPYTPDRNRLSQGAIKTLN